MLLEMEKSKQSLQHVYEFQRNVLTTGMMDISL